MYGYWRRPNNEPTRFGQAMQQSALYDPTTTAVSRTYIEEATVGVGTGYADIQALNVKLAEESGVKISEEEYKNSPELYSEGVSWYEGMTKESARISKEFNDSARKRAQILQDASTRQAIVGFTAGFGAGVVEPKNLAIGVGVSLAAPLVGTAGWLGNNMRRMYQLRKTASLVNKVKIGAVEGVAAGALVEPSNRYSARTLQQDYTMMDSAFNVFTSTAFGAGLPAGVHVAGKAGPFMQAKIDKFRGRAMDVATTELDLATTQLHTGQRVDVSAVEAHEIGKLVDKPIAQQVRAVKAIMPERLPQPETFDIPSPPTKEAMDAKSTLQDVPINKIASAQGKREWDKFNQGEHPGALIDGYADHPVVAQYSNGDYILFDGNHRTELAKSGGAETIKAHVIKVADYAPGKDKKPSVNKGMTDDELLAALGVTTKEIDAQNATTIQKHNTAALDYRNDSLIDYDAIDAMDERKAIMETEAAADAEAYYQQAEAEIRQMLDEGTMNEADLEDYRKILEDLNDSKKTTDALETLKLCLTGL